MMTLISADLVRLDAPTSRLRQHDVIRPWPGWSARPDAPTSTSSSRTRSPRGRRPATGRPADHDPPTATAGVAEPVLAFARLSP